QRDLYPLLPLCLCVRVLADSAEGMCHLHGLSPPVAHHALKPSNILLDRQCRAKIADFGYSQPRPLSSATLDNADQECRVLVYQSPERLQGAGPSLQDDVFGSVTNRRM
ncbi:hypothetical protein FKM82_031236, partial [Ascaphus truei]